MKKIYNGWNSIINFKISILKKLLLFFAASLISLSSYSQTFVSTTAENKNVILEEFTGISCGYCPDGHAIGQSLHDNNPNDIFLINIHTGGYATPQGPGTDFNTSFGAAIAGQSGLAGYPAGTANRHQFSMSQGGGTAMSRGDWSSASNQLLAVSSPVNVGVQSSVDMATNTLTVDVEVYYTGTQTVTSNKLNVAIIQNGILGPQSGGANYNPSAIDPATGLYTHNHMLRHMLTGQWGEQILDISQGVFYSNQFTWNMPANINGVLLDPTNIAVVAFVSEGNQEILSGTEVYPNLVFANAYDAYLVSASAKDNICNDVSKGIEVLIKNYGNLPLTTLDIEYSINGGAPYVFPWVGNLASGQAATVTLSNYPYTPSFTNTLNVSVSNPNGNTDQNTSNDNASTTFINHSYGSIVTGIVSGNATIDVTTDQYANETSWELLDDNGIVVVASGTLTNSSAQPTVNVMLDIGACYTFNMYDSYGDGIYPPNGFEVKDLNGNIIVSNYNFTTSEDKTPFEITGSSPCSGLTTGFPVTTPATCTQQNGTATIQGSGGTPPYTYQWSNGQATPTVGNLSGGSYSCIITDANGCTSTNIAGVGVDNSNSPISTSTSTDNNCFGDNNGSIDLTTTGGTPPYTYSWSNGAQTEDLMGIPAGTYLAEYMDANGCVGYESVTVNEPSGISIQSTVVDESGSGTNDGSITVNASGGTPPYTYSLNGGVLVSSNIFSSLSAGTYNLEVYDANGCANGSMTIVSGGATAIEDVNSQLLIYPNPVKDILIINGMYNSVEIYDIYGKLVLISNTKKTINVSTLSDGVYFLNINTNNAITVKKITVTK